MHYFKWYVINDWRKYFSALIDTSSNRVEQGENGSVKFGIFWLESSVCLRLRIVCHFIKTTCSYIVKICSCNLLSLHKVDLIKSAYVTCVIYVYFLLWILVFCIKYILNLSKRHVAYGSSHFSSRNLTFQPNREP